MTERELPPFECHEFLPKQHKYCVVIGVLNEGVRFENQMDKIQPELSEVDLIIVDGGSEDSSSNQDYVKSKNIRTLLVQTGSEFGLCSQYRIALAYCLDQGYEGIITVDGNDKDGMEAIKDFVREFENGYDFIQGSRFLEGAISENTPLDRIIAIKYIHVPLTSLVSGFKFTDTMNGFKAFSARYLQDEKLQPFRHIFYRYNLQFYLTMRASQLGYKVKEIPVRRSYPAEGPTPSKIKGFKGRYLILWESFLTWVGYYNPR